MKTTVNDRGEISVPAGLPHEMHLEPGQTILWEVVSDHECRLTVVSDEVIKPDPIAALGFAQRHGLEEGTTAEWMKILREGESD